MSAATTASVVGIAVGVNSLTGGQLFGTGGKNAAAEQQRLADPFSSHRAEIGDEYAKYLKQGDTVDPTKMAGFSQFKSGVLDPSMEAAQRKLAASGQMQSGNEQIALQGVGQQGYYGFMTDYMNRLATASGANQNPSTGAGQGMMAGQNYDQQMMQGLGGTLQGIAGLYGGRGSSMQYNPIQADTGSAANTAQDYYGSTYNSAAGWSI
jgi:hypothetical protein